MAASTLAAGLRQAATETSRAPFRLVDAPADGLVKDGASIRFPTAGILETNAAAKIRLSRFGIQSTLRGPRGVITRVMWLRGPARSSRIAADGGRDGMARNDSGVAAWWAA